MARIELAPAVAEDFERIINHHRSYQVEADTSAAHIKEIIAAIDLLGHSPLIGRPAATDLRELVIGRRNRGYVVLYRYIPEFDTVFILVIKSQREAGYA